MITINFIANCARPPCTESTIHCKTGQNAMEAAVGANVEGIAADCGGMLTCGTCHVYVREPHASQLPAPAPDELAMLEFVAAPRRANSRLSCQIVLTEALDGLTLDLPDTQY